MVWAFISHPVNRSVDGYQIPGTVCCAHCSHLSPPNSFSQSEGGSVMISRKYYTTYTWVTSSSSSISSPRIHSTNTDNTTDTELVAMSPDRVQRPLQWTPRRSWKSLNSSTPQEYTLVRHQHPGQTPTPTVQASACTSVTLQTCDFVYFHTLRWVCWIVRPHRSCTTHEFTFHRLRKFTRT